MSMPPSHRSLGGTPPHLSRATGATPPEGLATEAQVPSGGDFTRAVAAGCMLTAALAIALPGGLLMIFMWTLWGYNTGSPQGEGEAITVIITLLVVGLVLLLTVGAYLVARVRRDRRAAALPVRRRGGRASQGEGSPGSSRVGVIPETIVFVVVWFAALVVVGPSEAGFPLEAAAAVVVAAAAAGATQWARQRRRGTVLETESAWRNAPATGGGRHGDGASAVPSSAGSVGVEAVRAIVAGCLFTGVAMVTMVVVVLTGGDVLRIQLTGVLIVALALGLVTVLVVGGTLVARPWPAEPGAPRRRNVVLPAVLLAASATCGILALGSMPTPYDAEMGIPWPVLLGSAVALTAAAVWLLVRGHTRRSGQADHRHSAP